MTPPATATLEPTQAHEIIDRPSGANVFETEGSNSPKRRLNIIGALAATTVALAVAASTVRRTESPIVDKEPTRRLRFGSGQGGAGGSSGSGGAPTKPGSGVGGAPSKGTGGVGGQAPFQEDACGPNSILEGIPKEKIGKLGDGEALCTPIINPDGSVTIEGHPMIDQNGIPQVCFFSNNWTGGAAIQDIGAVSGYPAAPAQKGKIYLKEGKMCMTMLHENPDENAESIILGEAPVRVTTRGKVLIKRETETDPATNAEKHFVVVYAVDGETTIHQDGGNPPDRTIQPGDLPYKYQLDIEHLNTGCMVTSSSISGAKEDSGGYILSAGAIFYLLTQRRRKNKNARHTHTPRRSAHSTGKVS